MWIKITLRGLFCAILPILSTSFALAQIQPLLWNSAILSACAIFHYEPISKQSQLRCSGSFISDGVFLTAAHCLRGANPFDHGLIRGDIEYYVVCPNDTKPYKVLATIPHSSYWGREHFNHEGEFEPSSNRTVDTTKDLNLDLAIMVTEKDGINHRSSPILSNSNQLKSPLQCVFQGFSPTKCDISSGKGCFRKKIYSDPSVFKNSEFDSLNLGAQGHGDSGSGTFCLGKDNKWYLSAVNVRNGGENRESVSLLTKDRIAQDFQHRTYENALKAALAFKSSQRYEQAYLLREKINHTLEDFGLYLLMWPVREADAVELLKDIDAMITADLKILEILQKKGIRNIRIAVDGSSLGIFENQKDEISIPIFTPPNRLKDFFDNLR